MQNWGIESKQVWMWLLAAMSAPLACCGGVGLTSVGLAAAITLPLIAVAMDGWGGFGKILSWLEIAGTLLVLGTLLPASAICWPSSKNELVVPLTILALGALSGSGIKCARVGSVIAMILVLLYLPLTVSAMGKIRLDWLVASGISEDASVLCVLLIPSLTGIWNREKRGRLKNLGFLTGIGILFAGIVQGTLSLSVSAEMRDSFWQVSRCLGRFEPITAVALTLGWYALATFLIRAVCRFAFDGGIKESKAIFLAILVPGLMVILKVEINVWILAGIESILWVLMPLLKGIKKLKKIEKSA